MQSEKEYLIKNYKDRGMIKWQPFSALEGHQNFIDEMLDNKKKNIKLTLEFDLISNNKKD